MMFAESIALIQCLRMSKGRGVVKSNSISAKARQIKYNCESTCRNIQDSPATRGQKRKSYAKAYRERDLELKLLEIKLEQSED